MAEYIMVFLINGKVNADALYFSLQRGMAPRNSDTRSFGFRKGRSSQDAMAQLFTNLARRNSPQWIVEGDIKACFDETAHEWLLQHTPMNTRTLHKFLKAGYVYQQQRYPTERGTPQGGTISPILANHTLNGIEQLLKKTYTIRSEGKGNSYRKIYKCETKKGFLCMNGTRRPEPGTNHLTAGCTHGRL